MNYMAQHLSIKGDPFERAQGVEEFLDELDALGSTVDISGHRAAIATFHRIRSASVDQGPRLEALQRRLADSVLDGALDVDQALDEIAEADRLNARGGAGERFLTQLAKTAAIRVWWSFSPWGENARIIHELLAPIHDAAIARLRDVVPGLLDVTTADEAIRRRLGTEWQDAVEAYEAWDRVHALAAAAREAELDSTAGKVRMTAAEYHPIEYRFREPTRVPDYRSSDFPARHFWLYAQLEHQPAMLTAKEVLDIRRRDEMRERQARNAGTELRQRTTEVNDSQVDEAVNEVLAKSANPILRGLFPY